jgi:DNA-binding winged helix-turn-helix (wHTH) protein/tetratricopeptide (TPR) repeat protein
MTASQWCFDRFRVDATHACLWRDTEVVPLPPKAFDVLRYVVTHPDRLVTKDELLEAVWPATAVGEAVIRVAIGALRKALGDTRQSPRFLATVPRRGYRFIAPVTTYTRPEPALDPPLLSRSAPAPLVEREAVLQQLEAAWAQACQGRRQVVWVTGEAGIGKTAVVEAFVARVATDPAVALATGQCVEQYGTTEAYLPVLEALGPLCRGQGGGRLVALLRQHAPTWLVQFPWLLSAVDRAHLALELQGATRERMLREFADVLEVLTAETPLLLVFEDLHWCDAATVDLLALLTRRRAPARLLVVGTYRPGEALVHHHPLLAVVHAAQRSGVATESAVPALSPAGVAAYLAAHFPSAHFPATLAVGLHRRTDGNPLFLVTLVQALVEQGLLHAHVGGCRVPEGNAALAVDVPESLHQVLVQQLARLPRAAHQALEVASVVGVEFATAAVAACLGVNTDVVDMYCATLVRQHLLRPLEVTTWPNGTIAARYAFRHVLYQEGIYQGLGVGQRVQLHRHLGTFLETAYGSQAGEIAAALAEHFGRGQDTPRAVHYLHRAAENAAQRYAHREVVELVTRALALLQQLPETPARAQQELDLSMALGPALIATRGQSAPEVHQTYVRAGVLCHQVRESPQLPQTLVGLMIFHTAQGEHHTAQELSVRLLDLAQCLQDPVVRMNAHGSLGVNALYLGDIVAARGHLEQCLALCDGLTTQTLTLHALFEWGVVHRIGLAWALQQLGYPEQARQRSEEALALARQRLSPFNLSNALVYLAVLYLWCCEWHITRQWIEETANLTPTPSSPLYLALGRIIEGAAFAALGQGQEGLACIHQGLAACHALGAQLLRPWALAMLAESYARLGQPETGLTALAEAQALMATTRETFYAAEIARLQGQLLLQTDGQALDRRAGASPTTAETCFQYALEVARRQQARWWELRAAVSLSRLWQQQGKQAEAHALLAPIYGWFTEGFDTADLQEAKTLLDALV